MQYFLHDCLIIEQHEIYILQWFFNKTLIYV